MHPAGQKTARLYDALGRLTRLTEDYLGIDRHTDYAYDRASRLTRQTGYRDGTSGVQNTDYAYNKAGVKTLVTYPDSGTVNFVLDSVSRVTRQTDPRGISIDQAYDVMGRRTLKHEGTNVYWTYGYNVLGALTLARKGTSAGGDQVARTDRIYNGLGRLTLETQQITGALTRSVGYDYDIFGNVIGLYYPGGDVTIAHTVTTGNQTDLIQRDGTQIGDYNYVGSQVRQLMYETGANDVIADRYYDGAGRLTRLAWDQVSNTLPKFAYSYDPAGNILTKTHDHRSDDPIEKYGIDSLYRLTDARYDTRSVTHGFTYDDLGNRLTFDENANQTTYGYNVANELTKKDSAQVSYDKNGNLTKDAEGYTYHYDRQNQLTRIKKTNDSVDVAAYAYDTLGRRIERIDLVADPDVTIRCYYDGDQVIEDTDASANVQRYYIWGNYVDELMMMWREEGQTDADYFVARNHLFSPVALVRKSDASITERYEYDAYGKVTFMGSDYSALNPQQSSVDNRYLFTGRELDNLDGGNLKVMYYRARYYDPVRGRFLQRDPAGYRDGMNLYQYVVGNPVRWRDPYGLGLAADLWDCKGWIGGIAAGVGGVVLGYTTAPVWIPVVIIAGGTALVVLEITDIWDTAEEVVDPIREPVREWNRRIEEELDNQNGNPNCFD